MSQSESADEGPVPAAPVTIGRLSCLGAIGAVVVLAAGGLLLLAWLFMSGVDAARSGWVAGLPPIGYWSSVKVCAFGLPLILAPVLSHARIEGASWLFAIPLTAGMLAMVSWLFMLGVGVVHAEWLRGLPTIGYWASVKIWIFAAPLMFARTLWSTRPSARRSEQVTSPSEGTEAGS
jgi:hypothetical protein